MDFNIKCVGSRKRIKVQSLLDDFTTFNGILDPDEERVVYVTYDDKSAPISVSVTRGDEGSWIVIFDRYLVKAGEVLQIPDAPPQAKAVT